MLDYTADNVLPKETVLLPTMIGNTALFEVLRVDSIKVEFDTLANVNRSSEREAIKITQPLSLNLQPVTEMSERFKGLHLNRFVCRDAVVAWIRK